MKKTHTKPIPITGCYRFKLSEEMWDKMSFTQRCYELQSLPYSSEVIMEWAKPSWSELKQGQRQRITGELRGKLHLFANKKFHGVKAVDRRVELCPDNNHYQVLQENVR